MMDYLDVCWCHICQRWYLRLKALATDDIHTHHMDVYTQGRGAERVSNGDDTAAYQPLTHSDAYFETIERDAYERAEMSL